MSISCLKNCRPGDTIVWNTGSHLKVVNRNASGWPIVMATDHAGNQTGRVASVTDIHIGNFNKIIKAK
jgi:hypothetical protein